MTNKEVKQDNNKPSNKLNSAQKICDFILMNGPFLSPKDRDEIRYLYSHFSSSIEVINMVLIHYGNRLKQDDLELFCFSLMNYTKDYEHQEEIIKNYIKSSPTLTMWRMVNFSDESFNKSSVKSIIHDRIKDEGKIAIARWLKKWPEDEKYLLNST